ncbi:hypothetical protein C0989_001354 [Termitomyces sp. Mn162]|nr:hypothetical protein C0989_001354 [Termitomyces sp. Mn162]
METEWLHYMELAILIHLLQQPAEVVDATLAEAEEPSSSSPSTGAAPTEAGSLSVVVGATSGPSANLVVSSKDVTTDEFMKLDYVNELYTPINANPELTDPIIPDPSDTSVATNIATPIASEAGTSGSSDTTNIVSEGWADIVSSKEASSSHRDKWVGWTTHCYR